MKGFVKSAVVLGVAVVSLNTVGQTTAPAATPTSQAGIEIINKSSNQIPPQYRSEAPKPQKPFTVRYSCPESGPLVVLFDNAKQMATVEMGDLTRYLKQAVSADGGRYLNSDKSFEFWVKGKQARINGKETCTVD